MNTIGLIQNAVVVTRHKSLIEYLKEIELIDDSATIISHATAENISGKEVVGVLPHSLSCQCISFTEVPLDLPADKRGQELSIDDLRQFAGKPVMYRVITM